ncbi:hypothetical protein V6N13_074187 [Hibiscus sabdariffa]
MAGEAETWPRMEEATSRIKPTCVGKGAKTVVSHPEADGATEATGDIGATGAGTETGVGAAGALIRGTEATEGEATEGAREWGGRSTSSTTASRPRGRATAGLFG